MLKIIFLQIATLLLSLIIKLLADLIQFKTLKKSQKGQKIKIAIKLYLLARVKAKAIANSLHKRKPKQSNNL